MFWPLQVQQCLRWPGAVQSGSCLPGGTSLGSCPEVPPWWQQPCAHRAMFRSGDSLSLATLIRKHFLCSLQVFCAPWML